MNTKEIEPADNYEGLRKQFFAMRNLLASKEVMLEYYYKELKRFSFERIISLEAELLSEQEMNSILTKELNKP